ncbi:hypothetical protein RHMOL_Rhmol12G0005300 [Rhododendron molle]|uniref:Uncharacterized protein n=1 Tax=Rhododendron molle TaxID=49168 RepID=A0ACC0LDT7_RHOML|nr:hypothetical protein RHMOL_Rhmol12G0005300 [Rhododendron molle]
MKPQADRVKNSMTGIPSSSPAVMVKLINPSETIQVTGGTSDAEALLLLILETRLRNGARAFFPMDSQREGISWVALAIRRRQPIWNRFESEIRQAIKRIRSSSFE